MEPVQIERFYLGCLAHASYMIASQGVAAVIDPQRDVDLVVYPPKRTILDILSNPLGSSAAQGVGVLFGRPEARLIDSAVSTLRRFRRGEPLAIMPNLFLH